MLSKTDTAEILAAVTDLKRAIYSVFNSDLSNPNFRLFTGRVKSFFEKEKIDFQDRLLHERYLVAKDRFEKATTVVKEKSKRQLLEDLLTACYFLQRLSYD